MTLPTSMTVIATRLIVPFIGQISPFALWTHCDDSITVIMACSHLVGSSWSSHCSNPKIVLWNWVTVTVTQAGVRAGSPESGWHLADASQSAPFILYLGWSVSLGRCRRSFGKTSKKSHVFAANAASALLPRNWRWLSNSLSYLVTKRVLEISFVAVVSVIFVHSESGHPGIPIAVHALRQGWKVPIIVIVEIVVTTAREVFATHFNLQKLLCCNKEQAGVRRNSKCFVLSFLITLKRVLETNSTGGFAKLEIFVSYSALCYHCLF